MADRVEDIPYGGVLVIETDSTRRVAVEAACRAAGVSVLAVSSIAEVERWPEGQVVITDAAHLTPWWQQVGAVDVIALVNSAEEGLAACEKGATKWLLVASTSATVLSVCVRTLFVTATRCSSAA